MNFTAERFEEIELERQETMNTIDQIGRAHV